MRKGASPPPTPTKAGGDLITTLLDHGLITPDQIQIARRELGSRARSAAPRRPMDAQRSLETLEDCLVDLGFVTRRVLSELVSERHRIDRFDPERHLIDIDVARRLPEATAHLHRILPIALKAGALHLAMVDPFDVAAMDIARRAVDGVTDVIPVMADETDLTAALDRIHGYEMSIDGLLRRIEADLGFGAPAPDEASPSSKGRAAPGAANRFGFSYPDASNPLHSLSLGEGDDGSDFNTDGPQNAFGAPKDTAGEGTGEGPVASLVDALLIDAVKRGASDLHFEPEGAFVRLRYRIDGTLRQIRSVHADYWPAIATRLKIMAGMNIAERNHAQDGRLALAIDGRDVDFRASSHPTVHGENIVLRVLDRSHGLLDIGGLGLDEAMIATLTRLVARPQGIMVVTGPTGSGKTTTLYALLGTLDAARLNIMTLEEPVEYQLPRVRQCDIGRTRDMSYADGIRAVLRQDPDVLLVGEMRDEETAHMAVRAAMTGHRVLTTLHTADALGAIPRLLDLGLRPTMLAGQIVFVFAQRLVRRLCGQCREWRPATDEEALLLGRENNPSEIVQVAEGMGCPACDHSGFRGRRAIAEILRFSDDIDELVIAGAGRAKIARKAREDGFRPMVSDARAKVLAGETSLDEIATVVDLGSV